jgi:hypothetical protein
MIPNAISQPSNTAVHLLPTPVNIYRSKNLTDQLSRLVVFLVLDDEEENEDVYD